MGKMFGTDGVRGIANVELTPLLAFELGRACGQVLSNKEGKTKAIIGQDTRISSDMLSCAFMSGLMSLGVDVVDASVVPTPLISYLIRDKGFDFGVMISASHNPMEYNGIKVFNNKGMKLSDELEDEIEEVYSNSQYRILQRGELGVLYRDSQLRTSYIESLTKIRNNGLDGLKVVLDCANGATSIIGPEVFVRLGAEVVTINNKPDGININKNCGSTHTEGLSKAVLDHGAQLGLAFDGDGDRLIAVDDKGEIVDGDKLLYLFGKDLKKRSQLNSNTVALTVMSNIGLKKAFDAEGIEYCETKVGDRYVLEAMLDNGYNLGGEQSGHIILLDHNTTGDGILSGVLLAYLVARSEQSLSEMSSEVTIYPQVMLNAVVSNSNKYGFMDDETIKDAILSAEESFMGRGRVLVRPSGTEPYIRVMLEGENLDEITKKAEELKALIEERLG